MRILIGILSELSHERRLERMAESLRRAGHELRVTWVDNGTHPPSSAWPKAELIRLPNARAGRRKSYFARFMRQWYRLLHEERPQAVLAIDPPALGPAALAKARLGYRLIYDSREYYIELPTVRSRPVIRGIWRCIEGYGIRRSDSAFSVCSSIARELERLYGVRNVGVVRNMPGYSYNRDSVHDRRRLQQLLPELGDGPVLLYQGGFWPGYDFAPLLRMLGKLAGNAARSQLVLLGDGPGAAALRELRDTLPWKERVHIPGKVRSDLLPELTRGADLGLIPIPDLGLSYRYILPNKLFEYLQAGLPLLASPLPELQAIIEQRDLGRCVSPQDESALASAVTQLLDPAWRVAREEAFARAALDLCWEEEESRLLECFRS